MAGNQRRPWLRDIQRDGNGDYAYHGSHKRFSGGADALRRFRVTFGILAAGMTGCVIAAGCLSVGKLDNTAYVLIPYLFEVVLTAAFAWSAVRLLSNGELIRTYVHAQTAQRLPKLALALAVAAAGTLTGAVVFTVLHRPVPPGVWIYLALQCALIALSLCNIKVLRRTQWVDV